MRKAPVVVRIVEHQHNSTTQMLAIAPSVLSMVGLSTLVTGCGHGLPHWTNDLFPFLGCKDHCPSDWPCQAPLAFSCLSFFPLSHSVCCSGSTPSNPFARSRPALPDGSTKVSVGSASPRYSRPIACSRSAPLYVALYTIANSLCVGRILIECYVSTSAGTKWSFPSGGSPGEGFVGLCMPRWIILG